MPITQRRTTWPDLTAQALWDWHARPGAFDRLVPPWARMDVQQRPEPLREGATASMTQHLGPLGVPWRSVVGSVRPPHGFEDRCDEGPFSRWQHTHTFTDGVLEDHIDWALPAPARWVAQGWAARELDAMLAYRHRQTQLDLQRHARWQHAPRLTVGITGATGLVGQALTAFLTTGGHTVVPFVRRPGTGVARTWDPTGRTPTPGLVDGLDAVVHLAGAPISGARWTEARKAAIRDSRVQGTQVLAKAIAAAKRPPRVLVSASAVGIYGHRDELVDEDSPAGEGFLADVCTAWEAAAAPARDAGVRVVHPRVSIVQSGRGGALRALLPAFQWGLGAAFGAGTQGLPWIALDDLVGLLHEALFDTRYAGPINAVSPTPIRQRDHARALGRVLHRPAFASIPAPVVRALFGEMGQALLLEGALVQPKRLHALGFEWTSPDLTSTLRWATGRLPPDGRTSHAP